jgi:hypothetical protein
MTSAPRSPRAAARTRAGARRSRPPGTARAGRTRSATVRLPEQARHDHEVIVVHPAHSGSPRLDCGEALVHVAVGLPPAALEDRLLDHAVQQWPERTVGEAVIVVVDLARAHLDRDQFNVEARDSRWKAGITAVPPDPGSGARVEGWAERADKAADRRPPALRVPRYGQAVRVHDQPVAVRSRGCSAHRTILLTRSSRVVGALAEALRKRTNDAGRQARLR